jgi:hypothetical protein
MSIEIILLLLRILSGGILLTLLALLLVFMWRDYRGAVTGIEASRRVYGQLVAMQEVGGKLIVTGEAYPLLQLTSLGRSPTNAIIVDDTYASSDHALIALRDGQWWLEDRKSRNGTLLNETLLSQPAIVTDGDIIGIGRLRFRLELER